MLLPAVINLLTTLNVVVNGYENNLSFPLLLQCFSGLCDPISQDVGSQRQMKEWQKNQKSSSYAQLLKFSNVEEQRQAPPPMSHHRVTRLLRVIELLLLLLIYIVFRYVNQRLDVRGYYSQFKCNTKCSYLVQLFCLLWQSAHMQTQLPNWGIRVCFFTSLFQFLSISQSSLVLQTKRTAKTFFKKHVSHNVFFEGLSLCPLRSITTLLLTSVVQNQALRLKELVYC